jgi:hypothetical protein
MSSSLSLFRRADWIRTSDPYVPNVVRYRAALLPEKLRSQTSAPPRGATDRKIEISGGKYS